MAPGLRDHGATARAVHHAMLAHGLAVQAFRASGAQGEIGITNANSSYEPADETPETAIVQMEPIVRAREHWTLIPSFAGRRMAAGLPISLLPQPEYLEASEQVKAIYASDDAGEASAIARRLRIDYLYVDATDTAAYPDGVRKFDEQPALFSKMFSSGEARVYRVN